MFISILEGAVGPFLSISLEMKIIAAVNLLQTMKQLPNLHLQGGNDSE